MLLDQATPDTSIYMIAGYSAFALIALIYFVSLIVRARNLRRDMETLESLEAEAQTPAPAVTSVPAVAKAKSPQAKTGKAKPRQPSRKKATRKR